MTSLPHPFEALDLDRFVPFFLGSISNKWTASASKLYLREYGIGIGEWRVLGVLGSLDATRTDGVASSLEMVNLLGSDAAAISRATRTLERRGLIVRVEGRFAGRTKPYRMTEQGLRIFAAIRETALKREELLLQDLDPGERESLLTMLRRIQRRIPDLQQDANRPADRQDRHGDRRRD